MFLPQKHTHLLHVFEELFVSAIIHVYCNQNSSDNQLERRECTDVTDLCLTQIIGRRVEDRVVVYFEAGSCYLSRRELDEGFVAVEDGFEFDL